ncbi:hypothetical protein Tco_0725429 [Tanacetum coccineum]|uniref:Reverse transcriptase domain-containing protein n=1 Tax=Tanacetum coccineum TaxID=301880 RepID=A0ABQ4YEA3_9ASTR
MFDSSFHSHDPRIMEDFYRPSLIGRGWSIVPTTVPGTDFVLNNHMVQLLRQNCQLRRFKAEDANEHLDKILLLHQILTFYHGITMIDRDKIMVAAGRNIRRKTPQESYDLIKNMTQHHYQWDSKVQYDTTTDMSAHYSKTTFASSEQVEVLGNDTGYTIQSVQHQPGPGHPNTFHYTYSNESDEDEPSEVLKVQKSIHPLSGSPTPSYDSIVASPSPSLTPLGNNDFLLEETDAFFALDSIPPYIDDEIYDSEGYILFLEKLLEDEPFEAKKSEINPLIKEPPNTFLMGDKEITLNPLEDGDELVPIPRVSEKPLDSLDPISKTFDMTITNTLFNFDYEFTLNSENPIFDIQN